MKNNKNIFICALLVVMMLACISAVSAEDTLDADLGAADAADDAVELSIDDARESETLETGSSSGEILAADETVVTNDTFFNYFDENGVINKSISEKELQFSGEFSGLGIDAVTIDIPITVSAVNSTIFRDIGFKVLSDNVKLSGVYIIKNSDGIAVDIKGENVTVDGMGIGITNVGKNDTFAIRAIESNNLNLQDINIIYNAGFDANTTNVYNQVIQVRDSNNVRIKKNNIIAQLPVLDVDYSKSGIDTDYSLVIGIQNGENITIAENNIASDALLATGSYPTLNTIMVETVKNLNISNNNITSTDFNGEGKAGYLYVLDLYRLTDSVISGNVIKVEIPDGAAAKGSAYGMQLNGLTTNLGIYANNFTTIGNGYAYGIYVSDYYGAVEAEIINNNFDITGYAGTKKSNLVTAMELSITKAVIENNYISTKMLNNYSDDLRVFGICYSSSNKRNHTYTIQDNYIETEGKYAVYLMNVVDANVTENALFARELYGDDAVYIDSGSNIVEDNIPPYTVTNDTFFYFFDENGVIFDNWRELTFEGEFSGLGIDTITIDRPVIINGNGNTTMIEDIGFKILSDDVQLSNFIIARDNTAAIYIKGSDVTIDNVVIAVFSAGVNDTYAIRAVESDYLTITNCQIEYYGEYDANHTTTYQHVIDVRDSKEVIIGQNDIVANLPTMTVDWYGVGIDKDFPLVIGIQNCVNSTIVKNYISAIANPANSYMTLDVIMVNNVTSLDITANEIIEKAITTDDDVLYLYAVDLHNSKDVTVAGNDIMVNTTSGIDGSGAAYPIQITGPMTALIDENNLVAISKGPSYGIYASNWAGPVDVIVTNNVIDVTGAASNGKYSLIAGMALDAERVSVLGNDITVKNLIAYNDTNKAYGICNSQGGNHTFEILRNIVKVDGKYAISISDSLDSIVAINTLYGHELLGDNAVEIVSGSAIVKDNCPPFVITNETFYNFFDEDNYLYSHIPEGATLDFQGVFISNNYTVYINKPVNVISSTNDAVFEHVVNYNNKENCVKFNIVEGADGTNVTGISIINGDLFVIGASNVTIDGVYMKANMSQVGASTGFIAIHTGAYYTTVKNSYFENGGTGSSILVLGKGGKYASFDNNIFNVTGSSGNVVSSNIFVGSGENPECANYTNNIIYNAMPEAGTMYGMTVCGANNIIENNTIYNFKGSGIVNQWGATSTNNVYRNNTITGGASLVAGTYSIIENNNLDGALTIAEGCNATGNTAKTASISGKETIVDNNTFNGAVTIAAAAKNTTFTNNYMKDTLTVNSNDNVITDNQISSEKAYAIDLKSTKGNTVKFNELSSADKMGDEAVSFVEGNNNTVEHNGMNAIIEIEVADAWIGNNNTINVTVVNATGNVTIKVNGKEYETITLKDGKATLVVPDADIEAGLNDVIVDYSGNGNISADSKAASFYGLDNVVFTEVFFHYFDENGVLKDDVKYDSLIFKGDFAKSSTVKYIVIDRPIIILGDNAKFSQMGLIINSSDVLIGNLTFTATVNNAAGSAFDETLGALITVNGSSVLLMNFDINYRVTAGDHDAIAINVIDSDNVGIFNNKIYFESTVSDDEYSANAINIENTTNVSMHSNSISTKLPALYAANYDWDYFMMGLNTVNPIRIKGVTNISIAYNDVNSAVKSASASYPTIQSLFMIGTTNATIKQNNFTMVDTVSKLGSYTYLYAINFGYDKNVTVKDNNFTLSTKSGVDSAGGAYALQIVDSEIMITGNDIVTETNGPNLGIYMASMGYGNQSKALIAGNTIKVTGYATSTNAWALVSGIEVQNGDATISNNQIIVSNNADYVKGAPVYGVSYAQKNAGSRTLDVEKNYIDAQGDYAVYIMKGTDSNVTDNIIFAQRYYGDRAVYSFEGIVENNTPMNPYLFFEYDNITVGEDAVFNITFDANDTAAELSFVIDGQVFAVNVTNGTGQVIVPGLTAGEYTAVAYLTDAVPYGPDMFDAVLTVAKNPTVIEIDVADVKAGEDAEVTINVGSATGSVIAIIDGDEQVLPIKKGKATTTIQAITADLHNIVVIYNGDANNDAAYNTTSFYVLKNNSTVTINGTDVVLGEKSIINITIPENATGSVIVSVDDETFYYMEFTHENTGSIAVSFDKAGNHTVSAVYDGDLTHDIAYSDVITIVVSEKEVVDANITTPVDFKIGEEANVTVSIPNATGNVSVIVDGIETVVPLDENGTAVVPFNVTGGEHSVVVVYSGDKDHAPVVKTATFYAEELDSEFTNLTVSDDLVVTGVLVNSMGDPIANATIAYVVGNNSGNLTTGEDGSFTIAGESNAVLSVNYAGNDYIVGSNFAIKFGNLESARLASEFNVTEGISIKTYAVDSKAGEVGQTTSFKLTDSNGNPIVNATVKFAYKTVILNRTTDENGIVFIGINTQIAQEALCALSYLGDEKHNATFVAFSFDIQKKPITISAAAKTYKASAKTKKYTVTLKTEKCNSRDGKVYLSAGKKVTLKLNGKTYTAKTDKNGKATFSLKITKKGKQTAKISFAGDKTYASASKSVKITIK